MSAKTGGYAYPLCIAASLDGGIYDSSQADGGMTLRDRAAIAALSDLASIEDSSPMEIAEIAYEIADAMLVVRARQ